MNFFAGKIHSECLEYVCCNVNPQFGYLTLDGRLIRMSARDQTRNTVLESWTKSRKLYVGTIDKLILVTVSRTLDEGGTYALINGLFERREFV